MFEWLYTGGKLPSGDANLNNQSNFSVGKYAVAESALKVIAWANSHTLA